MTDWTPATYRIRRHNADSDVTGHCCGVFGVGPSVQPDGAGQYTVTHLPTGRAVRGDFPTEAEARRFAEGLAALRDDWPRVTRATEFTVGFRLQVEALDRLVRAGVPSLVAERAEGAP